MSKRGEINRLGTEICFVLGLDPEDVYRLELDRTHPRPGGSVTAYRYKRRDGQKYVENEEPAVEEPLTFTFAYSVSERENDS